MDMALHIVLIIFFAKI